MMKQHPSIATPVYERYRYWYDQYYRNTAADRRKIEHGDLSPLTERSGSVHEFAFLKVQQELLAQRGLTLFPAAL